MNSLASLVDSTLVSHAPFQAAVREIETCFEFAREASEPICVALIGPSRTGKSRVLDVCERQHPKVRREDGMYVPILRVTTPSKPTVKGLAEVLLEGLGAVDATRGTENERTRRVKYLMRNTETRMLMIDEFQHFFDKGTKLIMHHVADWLKILVDETRCALVVAGLPSCQTVIDSNEQLAGRFHAPILMPRFSWQDLEQAGGVYRDSAGFPPGDGVGIAVELLLLAEIRGRWVDPDERVLVAGNGVELIGQQRFVALHDGFPLNISRDDTTVSTRLLPALGQLFFLRGRSIHDRSPHRQFSEAVSREFSPANRRNRCHPGR